METTLPISLKLNFKYFGLLWVKREGLHRWKQIVERNECDLFGSIPAASTYDFTGSENLGAKLPAL